MSDQAWECNDSLLQFADAEPQRRDRITLDGLRWDDAAPDASVSLDVNAAAVLEGVVVKSRRRRRVLRLDCGAYAKEFVYDGIRAIFKRFFGGNAAREAGKFLQMSAKGIAVPTLVGWGRETKGLFLVRDVLITREIPSAVHLDRFMSQSYPALSFRDRQQFLTQLAEFVRGLHDQGVLHRDMHRGNVMITEASGTYSFFLLDVDRVRLHSQPLSPRQRACNLTPILTNLASTTRVFRFFRAYGVDTRSAAGRDFLHLFHHVSFSHRYKIWESKARRCLHTNRYFIKERRGGYTVYRRRSVKSDAVVDLLVKDPDALLETGETLKLGRAHTAAKVYLNGKPYFLKRYNRKGLLYRLKYAFRRSAVLRNWSTTWGFNVRGLPVPLPLVVLEHRRFRLLSNCYILFTYADDAQPLYRIWPTLDGAQKKSVLGSFLTTLKRLYFSGGFHQDLKWSNVLVRPRDNRFEVILIDLDGARLRRRQTPPKRRMKDVKRFFIELDRHEPEGRFKLAICLSLQSETGFV